MMVEVQQWCGGKREKKSLFLLSSLLVLLVQCCRHPGKNVIRADRSVPNDRTAGSSSSNSMPMMVKSLVLKTWVWEDHTSDSLPKWEFSQTLWNVLVRSVYTWRVDCLLGFVVFLHFGHRAFELRSIGHSVVVIRPNSHLLFLFLHAHHSYYTLCYFGYWLSNSPPSSFLLVRLFVYCWYCCTTSIPWIILFSSANNNQCSSVYRLDSFLLLPRHNFAWL